MRRLAIAFLAVAAVALPVAAASVAQGFLAQAKLGEGTIVSLTNNPGVVAPAMRDNRESLYGVVVSAPATAITTSDTDGQIQVAGSGVADAFVSDANGSIAVGDKITVDSLAGIGVKATTSQRIIGVAQASFDSKSPGAKKEKFKTKNGKDIEVAIGRISVLVGATYYNAPASKSDGVGLVPTAVQDIANKVAGRKVSGLGVIASVLLLLLTFSVAGIMLNGAVKGGMVSIGRNPLAQNSLRKGIMQVMAVGLGAILAGMIVSYLALLYL